MALELTEEQIAALKKLIVSGVKSQTTETGRAVAFQSTADLLAALAATEPIVDAEASASGSRTTRAKFRRG